jgi:dTDP-4-amino-4,6-dideoxygalactose transaminase
MEQDFLPFAKPSISQEAIAEVVACLESGWLTTGPRVKRFEDDLKTYLNAPIALTLSSATAGLHVALLSLNLQPGDEIITTPLTFVATLNTIVLAGAKPVLVDIDPSTYNIDINKISEAITPHTRAIVPVHFAGLPVDLDRIYQIADQHQLRVVEDAAHAIGAYYKKQILGSFGDTQVFSFHPNKNMTTGEGGCVTTRDEQLAQLISTLRFHGIDSEAWNRFSKQGQQHYNVVQAGFKYNMMDIQAALGIHQLQALNQFIEKRTYLAERYRQRLINWPQITLPQSPDYPHKHAWHLFAPLINPEIAGIDRDDFMLQMKTRGIGTGLHYQAAHLYPYYRDQFGYKVGDFPNAENIASRIVSLPLFPDLTDEQQDRVIANMAAVFKINISPTSVS